MKREVRNYVLPNGARVRKIKGKWCKVNSFCTWMYQSTDKSLAELISEAEAQK